MVEKFRIAEGWWQHNRYGRLSKLDKLKKKARLLRIDSNTFARLRKIIREDGNLSGK